MCTKVNMNSIVSKRLSDIPAGDCFLITDDPKSVYMSTNVPAIDVSPNYIHAVKLNTGELRSYENNTIVTECSVSIDVTN